jgi:signal transduction histidine kinase
MPATATAATPAAAAAIGFSIAIALCAVFAGIRLRLAVAFALTLFTGFIALILGLPIAIAAPTAPAATAIAATALIIIAPFFAERLFAFVLIFVLNLKGQIIKGFFDNWLIAGAESRRRAAGFHSHPRALKLAVRLDINSHAIAGFNFAQLRTLAIKHIKGRFLAGAQHQLAAPATGRFFFQHAQRGEASGRCSAHKARAFAMWAFPRRGF